MHPTRICGEGAPGRRAGAKPYRGLRHTIGAQSLSLQAGVYTSCAETRKRPSLSLYRLTDFRACDSQGPECLNRMSHPPSHLPYLALTVHQKTILLSGQHSNLLSGPLRHNPLLPRHVGRCPCLALLRSLCIQRLLHPPPLNASSARKLPGGYAWEGQRWSWVRRECAEERDQAGG